MLSSGIFNRVECYFVTNVAEQTIGAIFNAQAVQEEIFHTKLIARLKKN
jgi:hypothetical protein